MSNRACDVCRLNYPNDELFSSDQIRRSVRDVVRREAPNWNEDSVICESCLDRYRVQHLQDLIETEHGELSALDEKVLESITEHEILARNTEKQFDSGITLGQRLSDKLASFGGSWLFLILFGLFLLAWISFNSLVPKAEEFDPYPFILLNLFLSCLAAVQAPIIMMSQNRQEAKDRIRSEHDYQVNLKAELEIRQLHMKIDQLLRHQWGRLLEIQQLQFELMRDSRRSRESRNNSRNGDSE